MSKGFLTLLLLCYVPLESSLSQTGLVFPAVLWWRGCLSLQLLPAVTIPRDPSLPPPVWNSLPTLVSSLETL